MLCENLIQTRNNKLGLSVVVRKMSLDAPRSEEQLRNELLAHVLDCHECLAVVLFQEDALDKAGCDVYRQLFQDATNELNCRAALDPTAHLTEYTVQAFGLDALSDEEMSAVGEHVENCSDCRRALEQREALSSIKRAEPSPKSKKAGRLGLTGILGVHVPDHNIHLISRLDG